MKTKQCASELHVGERELPVSEFHKRVKSPDGLHTWCKTCSSKYYRSRKRTKDPHKRSHMKITYDLSPEMYEQRFREQQGKCRICGVEEEKFMIDHDHETGEVRGLLCRKCNTGLGFFKESAELLAKAADYVRTSGKLPQNITDGQR